MAPSETDAGKIGDESTLGFHLAGVDIPYPDTNHVCTKDKCGVTDLQSSRQLCWVERALADGGCAVVLAFVKGISNPNDCPAVSGSCAAGDGDGNGGASTDPSPTPGTVEKYVWTKGSTYYLKKSGGSWSTQGSYRCSPPEPIEWFQNYTTAFYTPTVGAACSPSEGTKYSCHGEGYEELYVQQYNCQKQ